MSARQRCMVVCLALLLADFAAAKVQLGSVVIGSEDPQEQWEYLDKFGYGIGSGTYELRLKLRQPQEQRSKRATTMSLDVFLDEDWANVEQMPECRRARDGPARASVPVALPASGEWGRWASGEVYQVVRPHIWYFALSACDKRRGSFQLNGTRLIDFELRMQGEGSEFGVEMQYMLPVSCAALLCFSAFLFRYGLQCVAFRQTTGSLHVVIKVLSLAMLLQFMGQLLHTAHLWRYSTDGIGFRTLDVLSEVSLMLSQVVQTALLIAIALGYTLLHSTAEDLASARPIAVAASLAHAALVGLGKMQDGASGKHHENEGMVGWSLLALRLALYVWFIMAAKASQQKGGFRLRAFLRQFEAAGSLYFAAYPVLFVVVQVVAPYLRHPIMQMGLLVMQTTSHSWLAGLFLSRGTYFQASVLGSSLLPGCTGSLCCGVPEKES